MLSLWSPKPQSLSSQLYCSASNPSSCICGFHFIFCGLLLFLMFWIIKVIYVHCGKFTMSIRLQRAGKEQVTNQHEWFESTCLQCFYILIKRGRDRQEQKGREWEACWKRCPLTCWPWLYSMWLHFMWFFCSPLYFFLDAAWTFIRTNTHYLFKINFFIRIILKWKSDHLAALLNSC